MFGIASMILAAVVLLPRPVMVAADEHDHGHEHAEGHEHDHGESLHEQMEEMNDLFRQIRRQGRRDAQNADTIDKLHRLATFSLAAKDQLPPMIGDIPASERDALTATYRKIMNELVTHLLAAENALLDGDNASAWESILAANETKGRGHELFIPEDE